MIYGRYFKRVFDFLFSLIGLIALSPFFLLIAVTLWVSAGESPFYVQTRVGRNLKSFKLIKFKTMRTLYDQEGNPMPDDERITFLGKVIRKTSLDEIPQVLNVLRGDMSLVGPRPLLLDYLPLYSPGQLRRHEVCPGITGWAQINGRNAISWGEKFEYDVWYVDHLCLGLDLRIMASSIVKVLNAENIQSTVGKFEGLN